MLIWIAGSVLRYAHRQEGVADDLREVVSAVAEERRVRRESWMIDKGRVRGAAVSILGGQGAALLEILLDEVASDAQGPPHWRSLVVPSDVLETLLEHKDWGAVFDRLLDVSNIDETRSRKGLKYLQQDRTSAIFVAGGYHRMHFVLDPKERLATVLGIFDATIWATHTGSRGIEQPTGTQESSWRRAHAAGAAALTELAPSLPALLRAKAAPAAPAPVVEEWITLNQIRDLGVSDASVTKAILSCRSEEALWETVPGRVTDDQFLKLETALARYTDGRLRRDEEQLSTVEILSLNAKSRKDPTARTYAAWLDILPTPQQRVVELERDVAIRVKGGPGTGKTQTAVLRATFLVKRARERGEPVNVGFFVFSRDLGLRVYEQFEELGMEEFLSGSLPQRLQVTSLHDWCERFLDVGKLGVEPIAPFRAEKTEKHRRALLEIALEEARWRLVGAEYDVLWQQFDTKSKDGVKEIETEISQFIKAREITDLQSYLSERRPVNWWLANTDKTFRRFVWEIYTIYQEALRTLSLIDSDDLVNDAIKEVTKSVWQQYRKAKDGFDYLVLDEAQDFFRNQLTLIRHLGKRPEGLMICYDEAQAVYSRYPTLREIGFDTDTAFEGLRLEQNFRSTSEIIAAIQALVARYPTCAFIEWRQNFGDRADAQSGPRPAAYGYATEPGMLDEVRDLVNRHLQAGDAASDIAVVAFDDDLLDRTRKHLEASKIRTHVLAGRGRRAPRGAVILSDAKHVKGMQFETCIVVGLDRDSVPDFRGIKQELQREVKREDVLRLFLVAISRCKRNLHLLWHGTEPSEFVTAMGQTVDRRG